MKVIYYSYAHYFDHSLHYLDQISSKYRVSFYLELHPSNMQSSMFTLDSFSEDFGVYDGKMFLDKFSEPIRSVLNNLHEFFIIYFPSNFFNLRTIKILYDINLKISHSNTPLIHFDDISPRSSILIKFLYKKKYIFSNVHDTKQHKGEELKIYKILKRCTYKKFDQIFIFNKFSLNYFVKYYKLAESKVFSTKLGKYYLYPKFLTENCREKQYLLFFGRISIYKGVDTFLDAINYLYLKFPNLEYIIAGKTVYNYSLPLISNSKIKIINKHITNYSLAKLIAESKLVILPYKEVTQSGALLTALAFNKPTIVSATGSFIEYIDDGITGVYFSPNNARDLADNIEKLLVDDEKYKVIENNLKIEKNSWDSITKLLDKKYKEFLGF